MLGMHYVNIHFNEDGRMVSTLDFTPDAFDHSQPYYQHYIWYTYNDRKTVFVCGIDHSPPSFAIRDRTLNENMFTIVIDGSGTINGKAFRRGDFFTVPAGVKTTMINHPQDPWRICWFSWRGVMPTYFTKILESFTPTNVYKFHNAESVYQLFKALIYCDSYSVNASELITGFSNMILSFFDKPDTSFENSAKQFSPGILDYVAQAKQIISQEYATVSISELSQRLHLNRKYFSRIFKDVTGISPQQYLVDIRLDCSEYYLLETSYSIEQIASYCGYTSYSSFVQAFTKKYGMSPKQFKASYR